MDRFLIKTINQKSITANHIGTVIDVIAGNISEDLKKKNFQASDFKYGFEIGSPKEFNSLGEAVLVNDLLFSTSTDRSSQDYAKIISGPRFVTSGMFLISKDSSPTHKLDYQSSSGLKLYDLYSKIYKTIKKPLAFSGFMKFSKFHANFIESPPITGLNIFENPQVYYTKPHIKRNSEYGFVVGVITDYEDKSFDSINKQLEVVLYKNPSEKNSLLSYHAHIITVDQNCKSENLINKITSKECLHLFCEDSLVTEALLNIFTIQDLKGAAT